MAQKKKTAKKISLGKRINKKVVIPIVALVAAIGIYIVYTSSAATCVALTFRLGSRGACVKDIQALANFTVSRSQGSLVVDGNYGTKTRDWIKILQAQNKLKSDGVVGPKTWKVLCGEYIDFKGWPVKEGQEFYLYAKHAGCKGWQ